MDTLAADMSALSQTVHGQEFCHTNSEFSPGIVARCSAPLQSLFNQQPVVSEILRFVTSAFLCSGDSLTTLMFPAEHVPVFSVTRGQHCMNEMLKLVAFHRITA